MIDKHTINRIEISSLKNSLHVNHEQVINCTCTAMVNITYMTWPPELFCKDDLSIAEQS